MHGVVPVCGTAGLTQKGRVKNRTGYRLSRFHTEPKVGNWFVSCSSPTQQQGAGARCARPRIQRVFAAIAKIAKRMVTDLDL